MARRKDFMGRLASALTFVLVLCLAVVGLTSCGSMQTKMEKSSLENQIKSYENNAVDYTHPDANSGNSVILGFTSFYNYADTSEVSSSVSVTTKYCIIEIESLGGKTVNWRSKAATALGLPITKVVIPSGKQSYVIKTAEGVTLEGEMEFNSGHVYQISGSWFKDNPAPELKISDLTARLEEVNAELEATNK